MIRTNLSPVLKRIWYSLFIFTPPSPAYPSFFTAWTASFYFHLNCIFIPISPRLTSKVEMSNPPEPINPKFPPFLFPSFSLSFFTPKSSSLSACSNLTNLLFSPISVLSSHYLLTVLTGFPLLWSRTTILFPHIQFLSNLHSNLLWHQMEENCQKQRHSILSLMSIYQHLPKFLLYYSSETVQNYSTRKLQSI